MKKSLIALAVLAAAGAASAQSSVQLYGIADVWFGQAKMTDKVGGVTTTDKQTKVDSGGVSSSRFGLKGSEDLGSGLKAIFTLEQGFDLDTGAQASAGQAFSREASVGVAGNFGQVKLGKQFTAYDDIYGVANNTFDANVSATKHVWAPYTASANNTIKYVSPSFNGFSGAVSYSLGEDKAAGVSAGSVGALNVQYANGPLVVAYGYQQEKSGSSNGANVGSIFFGDPDMQLDAGEKATYNLLSGSYNFGVAKLVGGINTAKFNYAGAADDAKDNSYQVGVEVPLASNINLGVGYAHTKIKVGGDDFAKSRGFSAALVYSLSKRTTAYAAYLNAKTDSEVNSDESKTHVYAVGVKHAF